MAMMIDPEEKGGSWLSRREEQEVMVVDKARSIEEKPTVVKVTDRGRTGVVRTVRRGRDERELQLRKGQVMVEGREEEEQGKALMQRRGIFCSPE